MAKRGEKAAATDKQRPNSEARARSLANLKPFQPGQSGNPAGRPKSITLSEALRRELAKQAPAREGEEATGETLAEQIARVLCQAAAGGSVRAVQEIGDRTEGRPRQSVDVDMSVRDWRAKAKAHGLTEEDVIAEARRIIESESATVRSGRTSH